MTITSYVNMDLAYPGARGRVNAMQNDKYTRRVVLSLYEHGVPWAVPAGCTATVRYRKTDGTGGAYDALPDGSVACSIADNQVTLVLAPQVCTAAGLVQLVVSLQRNEEELLTFPLQVQVQPDPGEGVKSVNYTALWGAQDGCYNLFTGNEFVGDNDFVPDFDLGAERTEIDVTAYLDPQKVSGAAEYGLALRVWFTDVSRGVNGSVLLTDRYISDIQGGSHKVYYCGVAHDPYSGKSYGEFVLQESCDEGVFTYKLCRNGGSVSLGPAVVSVHTAVDGDTYTVTLTLEDGTTSVNLIETENGVPTKITVDGVEIPWTWEGLE